MKCLNGSFQGLQRVLRNVGCKAHAAAVGRAPLVCYGCIGRCYPSPYSNGLSLQSILTLTAGEPALLAKYSVATKMTCSDLDIIGLMELQYECFEDTGIILPIEEKILHF